MMSGTNGTASGPIRRRRATSTVALGPRTSPEDLWDLHGLSLYAVACSLLGDETAALGAVTLGMIDLYTSPTADMNGPIEDTFRDAAECVYVRCMSILTDPPAHRTMTIPPLMVWIGQIALDQRSTMALCVFGGHTYRQAATLLDLSPEVGAKLLTSGLQELGRLGAA